MGDADVSDDAIDGEGLLAQRNQAHEPLGIPFAVAFAALAIEGVHWFLVAHVHCELGREIGFPRVVAAPKPAAHRENRARRSRTALRWSL